MSFLNRSKTSIHESPFTSKGETKERTFTQPTNTKPREDVMGNIQAFRDDIRKQISDKITKNYKFLDVSSPKTTDLKTLLSNKNTESSTPLKATIAFNDSSAKASTKKIDLLKDLSKRGDQTSPFRDSSNKKGSELLSQLAKIRDGNGSRLSAAGNLKNSTISRSPMPNKSPKKEAQSALDIRPLDYFKKEVEQKSYLDNARSSFYQSKQQDFKQDIQQILENGRTPKRRELSATATKFSNNDRNDRNFDLGLSQKVNQLRSSHIDLNSPSILNKKEREYENTSFTLKNHSIDHSHNAGYAKKDRYRNTAGIVHNLSHQTDESSHRRKGLDLKSLNILSPSSNKNQNSFSLFNQDSGVREKDRVGGVGVGDQLPLSRLYELQDLFYHISDKGFDQLPSEYIEELIKLSSVIMHRVKNSSYYNRT